MSVIDLPFSLFSSNSINISHGEHYCLLELPSQSLSEDFDAIGSDSYLVQVVAKGIDRLGFLQEASNDPLNALTISPVLFNRDALFYYLQGGGDSIVNDLKNTVAFGVDETSSFQFVVLPDAIGSLRGAVEIFNVSVE